MRIVLDLENYEVATMLFALEDFRDCEVIDEEDEMILDQIIKDIEKQKEQQ